MTDKDFFKQVTSIPLLTEEEEKTADFDTLVYHNLRLVLSIASTYSKSSDASLGDLFQNGCIGLCIAAERYDGSTRFSTFSYNWIKKMVLQFLNLDYGVHVPLNTAEFASTVRSTRSKLYTILEREPTAEEIAEDMNCEADKVRKALSATQSSTSLDAPIGDEEDATFGDTVAAGFSDPYHAAAKEADRQIIRQVLTTLSPREQELLELRFGLNGPALTLEETGKRLGLGKERTRQLENNAVRKLRHPMRANLLRDCLT